MKFGLFLAVSQANQVAGKAFDESGRVENFHNGSELACELENQRT
jgi:hypothetical protein